MPLCKCRREGKLQIASAGSGPIKPHASRVRYVSSASLIKLRAEITVDTRVLVLRGNGIANFKVGGGEGRRWGLSEGVSEVRLWCDGQEWSAGVE